jgi:uncharacterized membrane protein
MEQIAKMLMVSGLGIFELWAAIPAGLAVNLHPLLTGIASGLGSMLGVMLVIIIGDRLRNWLMKKKTKTSKEKGTIYKVWDKYGVIGLGMLAPLLTGALFGAAIGVSLGASPKRLLLWMSLGIVVWTIILTGLGTYCIAIFEDF